MGKHDFSGLAEKTDLTTSKKKMWFAILKHDYMVIRKNVILGYIILAIYNLHM